MNWKTRKFILSQTHTHRERQIGSREKKEERMDRAYCPLIPGIGLKLCGSHFPTRFLFDSILFHSDIISMHSFIFIEWERVHLQASISIFFLRETYAFVVHDCTLPSLSCSQHSHIHPQFNELTHRAFVFVGSFIQIFFSLSLLCISRTKLLATICHSSLAFTT